MYVNATSSGDLTAASPPPPAVPTCASAPFYPPVPATATEASTTEEVTQEAADEGALPAATVVSAPLTSPLHLLAYPLPHARSTSPQLQALLAELFARLLSLKDVLYAVWEAAAFSAPQATPEGVDTSTPPLAGVGGEQDLLPVILNLLAEPEKKDEAPPPPPPPAAEPAGKGGKGGKDKGKAAPVSWTEGAPA